MVTNDDCCNSCEEVREAYRKKGWAISNPDLIDQITIGDPVGRKSIEQRGLSRSSVTNTSVAKSLPSLAEQANSSESQIPVRKHQQNQSSTPTLSSPVSVFQSRSMPLQPL
ncbi:hypothetical protein Ancab_004851 [Ancistrocladus abbreviatus]